MKTLCRDKTPLRCYVPATKQIVMILARVGMSEINIPLISVVVPAYNAECTLSETIESILAQTIDAFEVIIVNDGSTDTTETIANSFARSDRRVRVITTPNCGVAAARNAGIQAARANYIAPVDADDLWHPEKLARQVAILEARPDVALVYSSRRNIDESSFVIKTTPRASLVGWASHRLTAFNAVGNGSAIMFRKSDALRIGGYDSRLRNCGAQGCEYFLFQIRLAQIGQISVDGDYLVGYRQRANAMSNNDFAMLQSRLLALEILADEVPDLAQTARVSHRQFQLLLGLKYLFARSWKEGFSHLSSWMKNANARSLGDGFWFLLYRLQTSRAARPRGAIPMSGTGTERRKFSELGPNEAPNLSLNYHVRRIIAKLDQRDAEYGRAFEHKAPIATPSSVPTLQGHREDSCCPR